MKRVIYSEYSDVIQGSTNPILTSEELSAIVSDVFDSSADNEFSAFEKTVTLIPRINELDRLSNSIIDLALTMDIDTTDLEEAKEDFYNYLDSLTPEWDDDTQSTTVDREVFNTLFTEYSDSIFALQGKGFLADSLEDLDPAAANALSEVIDDNILSTTEKTSIVNEYNRVISQWESLNVKALLEGTVELERLIALDAKEALVDYLESLEPDWKDRTQNTPVDSDEFLLIWSTFYDSLTDLSTVLISSETPAPGQLLLDDSFNPGFWNVPFPGTRLFSNNSRAEWSLNISFIENTDYRATYGVRWERMPRTQVGSALYVRISGEPLGISNVPLTYDGEPIMYDGTPLSFESLEQQANYKIEIGVDYFNKDHEFVSRDIVGYFEPLAGEQTISTTSIAPTEGFAKISIGYPSQTDKSGAWSVYEPWLAEYEPAADVTMSIQGPAETKINCEYTGGPKANQVNPRYVKFTLVRDGEDISNEAYWSVARLVGNSTAQVDEPAYLDFHNNRYNLGDDIIIGTPNTTILPGYTASPFSFNFPNGTYTFVYTFDDNSTQEIQQTITTGKFTLAPYPSVRNRDVIKYVLLGPNRNPGRLNVQYITTDTVLEMRALYKGRLITQEHKLVKILDSAPSSGTGSSGTGGSVSNSVNASVTNQLMAPIGPPIEVPLGSSGIINLSAFYEFITNNYINQPYNPQQNFEDVDLPGENAVTQWYYYNGSSYVFAGPETISDSAYSANRGYMGQGSNNYAHSPSGATGSIHTYRLYGRSTGNWTTTFSGQVNGVSN